MEVAPYVAVAVVALLTTAGQYLWPSRARRFRRALAERPCSETQPAGGLVRLTGVVRSADELEEAPLSGRPCVAYEIIVDERVYGNVGMSPWVRRVDSCVARPFLVTGESGVARVDTSGPFVLSLRSDCRGTTSWLTSYPGRHGRLAQLLESAGLRSTNWFGSWRSFRYTEGLLERGAVVSVSGNCLREVDPEGERPTPRAPPERLVLRGDDAVPLLISDAPERRRDG